MPRVKLPKLAYLQPVWVKWSDAAEDPKQGGSRDNPEARHRIGGLAEAWEHGWFVRMDRKEFVIARTLYTDGDYSGTLTIPRGWVLDAVPDECPFRAEDA